MLNAPRIGTARVQPRGYSEVAGDANADSVSAAEAVVADTAVPAAFTLGGNILDVVVLRYPRTMGMFDPSTAEWIVLFSGGAAGAGGSVAQGGASGGGAGEAGAAGSAGIGMTGGPMTYGIAYQSCSGISGTECQGGSCCESIVLPGGSFPMGRGTETCDDCTDGCPSATTCYAREQPEHPATVVSV